MRISEIIIIARCIILHFIEPISECTNGDTRLLDGKIEQEGRPEVCVNGIWSQICDIGWSVIDGQVACLSLGYNGTTSKVINNIMHC